MNRTLTPANFASGGSYLDTHLAPMMRELKPTNAILQGGLVKAQGTPDLTVKYPDLIVAIGDSFVEVATDNTGNLSAASGTAQVETATVVAAAGATTGGDLEVILTGEGITGSPKTYAVAVTTADNTATAVATKIRTALSADSAVTDLYTVGGTAAAITLTRKIKAANDASLNLSIATGTAVGITAAPTSANTTAGVADAKKYAVLAVGANGTVDIVYGDEVPAASTPVPPSAVADHAIICKIGPILSTTASITQALIDNTYRDMPR